jgi:hypothetical protein
VGLLRRGVFPNPESAQAYADTIPHRKPVVIPGYFLEIYEVSPEEAPISRTEIETGIVSEALFGPGFFGHGPGPFPRDDADLTWFTEYTPSPATVHAIRALSCQVDVTFPIQRSYVTGRDMGYSWTPESIARYVGHRVYDGTTADRIDACVQIALDFAQQQKRAEAAELISPARTSLPEHARPGGVHAVGGAGSSPAAAPPPDWSLAGYRARWARQEAGLRPHQAMRALVYHGCQLVGPRDLRAYEQSDVLPDDLLVAMSQVYGVRLSFLRTGAVNALSPEDQAAVAAQPPAAAAALARVLSTFGEDP